MTRTEIRNTMSSLFLKYEDELDAMGPRVLSKKAKGDLAAGFRDGARSMLLVLQRDGHLTVTEDEATS